MRETRMPMLSALARAGQAHWFFRNLYEAVVHMPERLDPDERPFAAGSPVRYYLPRRSPSGPRWPPWSAAGGGMPIDRRWRWPGPARWPAPR